MLFLCPVLLTIRLLVWLITENQHHDLHEKASSVKSHCSSLLHFVDQVTLPFAVWPSCGRCRLGSGPSRCCNLNASLMRALS